ncbi:MAG: hypothetical protein OER90_16995, partial [Gemmatimonadota bacterium]|nr:hypothetical protein [Gemmatimonadota bacterium]
TVIELTDAWRDLVIPLSALRLTRLAVLPRPYPQFLPYLRESAPAGAAPRIAELDGLQFSVGADLLREVGIMGAHGFEIERVVLEPVGQ